MRTFGILLLLALAAGAGKREERYKKLGQAQLDAVAKANSNASRLKRLRRAKLYFERAKADGVDGLVETLNRLAGLYYSRKSLPLAEKRNAEALKLKPADKRALALQAAIRQAKEKDIYESVDGVVGIDRVRARRLATGVPLRDRGVARRR